MNRWNLLKHEIIKDNLLDIHYDLLIEQGQTCFTWKILNLPELDGSAVDIFEHSNHRLIWLTKESQLLSKDRGYVERVDNGTFTLLGKDLDRNNFSIFLKGNIFKGFFKKKGSLCRLLSINK